MSYTPQYFKNIFYYISFVNVYRLLHSDRDPIPDVPAVYFVLPTEENVQRICQVKVYSPLNYWHHLCLYF